MKISNYLIGLAATALLGSLSVAQAEHVPSPCATGEVGAGTNCMYLVAQGVTNNYDGVSGHRSADTGLTFFVDIWMDFGTDRVQGGGFDVLMDMTNVTSLSFTWNGAAFGPGERTLFGAETANGWEGIQFDDFAGNGYGPGSICSGCGTSGEDIPGESGFQLVGTLSITVSTDTLLSLSIAQPYQIDTFPNCFAPGAGTGNTGCTPTNFYNLDVNASVVPLPAAAWLMITALGSLAGFSRRKA